MKQPLISILIPFKNTACFITSCLDSILRQSYTNWEIIAVNDHSTDASTTLVASYAHADSRIHMFLNEGTGIISALRTAIKHSKGQLVTRMDSDDIMLSDKLLILSQGLIANGKGFVAVGGVKYFSKAGISNGYKKYEHWLNSLTATGSNYSELYKECVIPSPAWMVFRQDLDECGGFSEDRYPEDYDLTFRFYKAGLKIIPCGVKIHLWRDYPSRTSRTSEHYAQNFFLELKLHYFLSLHYDKDRVLCLWGAGNKGKKLAKELVKKKVAFLWLCDNPKKIDKSIYGKTLKHFNVLQSLQDPQSIITVANDVAQAEIRRFLKNRDLTPMEDYYFFC